MLKEFTEKSLCISIDVPFRVDMRAGEQGCVPLGPLETRRAYLAALRREVEASADLLEGREVCALIVGRGCGATLPLDGLCDLVNRLRALCPFARGAEVAVAMTPQTVGTTSLEGLNAGAFTRHYLDAWSFDRAVLEKIGAGFSPSAVDGAIATLDRFRFSNEAVNLLYGVPGGMRDSLRRSVDVLTQSDRVTHVRLTPWELSAREGVTDEDRAAEYAAAVRLLGQRGFAPYADGLFARKGGESAYELAKRAGVETVGFGAGAASRIGGFAYANVASVDRYIEAAGDFERTVAQVRALEDA